jgi:hypothetical protein
MIFLLEFFLSPPDGGLKRLLVHPRLFPALLDVLVRQPNPLALVCVLLCIVVVHHVFSLVIGSHIKEGNISSIWRTMTNPSMTSGTSNMPK